MTSPKFNRSNYLRALLVVGAVSAISGVSFAGAARPDANRAPRSVALVKAHEFTARPSPKQDVAQGPRGLRGEVGPAGPAGAAGERGAPALWERPVRPACGDSSAHAAQTGRRGTREIRASAGQPARRETSDLLGQRARVAPVGRPAHRALQGRRGLPARRERRA